MSNSMTNVDYLGVLGLMLVLLMNPVTAIVLVAHRVKPVYARLSASLVALMSVNVCIMSYLAKDIMTFIIAGISLLVVWQWHSGVQYTLRE